MPDSEKDFKDKLLNLRTFLQGKNTLLTTKIVTAGFDGFVDSIVKVIRQKAENAEPVFFQNIKEFGSYIVQREGKSFSLETEETFQKLGGNMPILANALATAGVQVNCIGAFGFPNIHPVFAAMPPNCRLYSFTNPGFTSALEFNDGKIMLAQMKDLNQAAWDTIKTAIGLENLINLYRDSDLIGFLNWSELDKCNAIWQGLLREVIPCLNNSRKNRIAFFDLSDCSKRSDEAIREALRLIEQFGQFSKVILSANKNEAQLLYKALCGAPPPDDGLENPGNEIFSRLQIDILIVHTARQAWAWDKTAVYKNNTFFIENPKISTGAGDNFNAGFCLGQLLELDLDTSLMLANAVSGWYIQSGKSPEFSEISDYLFSLSKKYNHA